MYVYEYTDDIPRDFPTLGLRDVSKGQQISSTVALNSPFLKEVTKKAKQDSTEKAGGE